MNREIIEVQWTDSMSARGWRTKEETDELLNDNPIIHSIGYLFKKDKKKIAIVGSVDHQKEPNTNQYQEIPMSAVRSVRRLR